MILESFLTVCLTIVDELRSPEAKDVYTGLLTLAGLALVAELVLEMFGR